jgi:multidrug resistance efflux pump
MNHDSRSFEDELSSLKADVAVIRSNYVTKADLQAVRHELQDIRLELKAEIQNARLEIKDTAANCLNRLNDVQTELKSNINGLRIDNEQLRGEMHAVLEQVQTSLNAQTWRIIGAVSGLVVAVYFIAHAGY